MKAEENWMTIPAKHWKQPTGTIIVLFKGTKVSANAKAKTRSKNKYRVHKQKQKPEAKAKAKQEAEQLQMLKIDNKTTIQGIQWQNGPDHTINAEESPNGIPAKDWQKQQCQVCLLKSLQPLYWLPSFDKEFDNEAFIFELTPQEQQNKTKHKSTRLWKARWNINASTKLRDRVFRTLD